MTQELTPLAPQMQDNLALRRILYALTNAGVSSLASETTLLQVLSAIQNIKLDTGDITIDADAINVNTQDIEDLITAVSNSQNAVAKTDSLQILGELQNPSSLPLDGSAGNVRRLLADLKGILLAHQGDLDDTIDSVALGDGSGNPIGVTGGALDVNLTSEDVGLATESTLSVFNGKVGVDADDAGATVNPILVGGFADDVTASRTYTAGDAAEMVIDKDSGAVKVNQGNLEETKDAVAMFGSDNGGTTMRLIKTDSDGSVDTIMRANTGTTSTVAASASSVTLVFANSARRGLVIVNDADKNLRVKFGATASATDFTYIIAANQTLTLTVPIYTGIVDGIWEAAPTGNARITELTQV